MEIGFKHNYCLLPLGRLAEESASAAGLALVIRRANLINLDVINLFDRILDLRLIGFLVHLERIAILDVRKVHALLCYQRFDDYVIIIHYDTC